MHLGLRQIALVGHLISLERIVQKTERVHRAARYHERVGIYDAVVVLHRRHHHTHEIVLGVLHIKRVRDKHHVVGAAARLLHRAARIERVKLTFPVIHAPLRYVVTFTVEHHRLQIRQMAGSDIVDCRLYDHAHARRKQFVGYLHMLFQIDVVTFHIQFGWLYHQCVRQAFCHHRHLLKLVGFRKKSHCHVEASLHGHRQILASEHRKEQRSGIISRHGELPLHVGGAYKPVSLGIAYCHPFERLMCALAHHLSPDIYGTRLQ